ncbi:MAG: DinB family protein [Marivirga sp.]|nr:DinB family protein [Marivirga sp.]
MTEVQVLTSQTENAYDWTNKLINNIPFEKWDIMPDVIQTNISWQVGHLIMSHYFHSIMVIAGHQKDILQQIPIKEYDGLFTSASPQNSIGKIQPALLSDQLNLMQQKSIGIVKALTSESLESKLEPTHITHPIAKTKREAIDWNIKHTMYHCGQIGILKRIIDERFDFGLKKPT